MPRLPIDSLDDPRLDVYRNLTSTNLTRWSGRFIAEGRRVVLRLLASDFEVESVLVSDRRERAMTPHVPPETPFYVLPLPLAQKLVGFNFHSGVLACGQRKPNLPLPELADNGGRPLTLVVCPNVNDPDNLGSIIRTGATLGVDALLLGRGCADPFSRRVSRLSMGHIYRLPIIECDDLHRDLQRLRDDWQVELMATVAGGDAEILDDAVRPERFALLFGNEAHGLEPEFLQLCRRRITIPMRDAGDSLNVSISAAIVLYHFTRSSRAQKAASR